ncbi:hypothetical protein DMA11_17155 [Marinilabiliaceae bacterium JC017]|nr:hypothetical protein DMA11_17155 [Marinilabiliaceae bacterium JC017]
MDANEKARQLLDESRTCYSDVFVDQETGEEWQFPKNFKEVDRFESYVNRIREIEPTEPDIIEQLQEDEDVLAYQNKRRFMGSKFLMVVFALIIIYLAYNNVYEPLTIDYTVEAADARLKNEIASKQKVLDGWMADEVLKEQNADKIEQYQEEIEELSQYQPAKYARKLNRQILWSSLLSIPLLLILIGILVAYYYASLAPTWLIEKRERRFNLFQKSAGLIKWLTVGLFTLITSMPSAFITKIKWSDGSSSTESDYGPMILKLIALVFLVVCILIATFFLVPIMAVVNYLRNYRQERLISILQDAWRWIKVKIGMEKSQVVQA